LALTLFIKSDRCHLYPRWLRLTKFLVIDTS
jgi:hypothetical protein